MGMEARRLYGIGVLVLGVGNVVFGAGQLVTSGIGTPVVGLVLGIVLAGVGALVVAGSDRLAAPALSDRWLRVVGVVGLAVGALLLVNGVGLLTR